MVYRAFNNLTTRNSTHTGTNRIHDDDRELGTVESGRIDRSKRQEADTENGSLQWCRRAHPTIRNPRPISTTAEHSTEHKRPCHDATEADLTRLLVSTVE